MRALYALNLSETELLVGEIAAAVATAEKGVAHADRSGDAFRMIIVRTTHADALHAAGEGKGQGSVRRRRAAAAGLAAVRTIAVFVARVFLLRPAAFAGTSRGAGSGGPDH